MQNIFTNILTKYLKYLESLFRIQCAYHEDACAYPEDAQPEHSQKDRTLWGAD